MKKILSFILSILMLSSLVLPLYAKDDAVVNYVLGLSANPPENGESYAVGETVKLTVFVRDIVGTQSPPIYGLNGALHYDAYLLEFEDAVFADGFETMRCHDSALNNKVAFSFLCDVSGGRLNGVDVDAQFMLGTFTFTAKKDGISQISLSDFIITNQDASARLISSADAGADVKIGSGVPAASTESLERAIDAAEADLRGAIVNPQGTLVYPAYSVTRSVYNTYAAAIEAARAVLSSNPSGKTLLAAERALIRAGEVFELSKLYGVKTQPGGSGIGGVSMLVEVIAKAGEHGRIADGYERQIAVLGTSVSVAAIPDEGYEVEKIIVNGVEYPGDTVFTIAKVTHMTKVEFFFKKIETGTEDTESFPYAEAVLWALATGMIDGEDGSLTYSELIQVLWRYLRYKGDNQLGTMALGVLGVSEMYDILFIKVLELFLD